MLQTIHTNTKHTQEQAKHNLKTRNPSFPYLESVG